MVAAGINALDVALDYIQRGWLPIPIPYRKKAPIGRAWQQLRLTRENAALHFNAARMNVGVRLGTPSGNLVDIDLDCGEALTLAARLLPPTGAIFGREGKPSSHRLYIAAVPKTVQFEDPTGAVDADGNAKAVMLLELRSSGGQTVFPGSVHESGERIDWSASDEPTQVDELRLAGDVADLAVACLLVRAAPAENRNAYLVDVAGALLRAHKDAASHIHHAVAQQVLGELYNKDAGERLLKDTVRKLKDDEPVTGWPRLIERVGEKRGLKIAHWLGYDPSKEQKQQPGGGEAKPEPEQSADRCDNGHDHDLAELARLNRLDYDKVRKAEAKRLGIRADTLDKLVAELRDQEPQPGAGRALEWPELEPWPDPVAGAALLDELTAAFRRFVVLPAACDTALALWVVHAHAFEASPITPRLAIVSPEKRCGKTTTLEIVQNLTPRPILASNVTAAALFRTIELARPVLLLDEADTFLPEAEELRGVLNSGNRRSGEVIRTVGDNHEPRRFSTWAPVAIAAIGKIPGTLEDRSITISMQRRAAGETVERWRVDRANLLDPIVRRCVRWARDHLDDLRQADPAVPDQLHDRAADNWRPLLAIADAAGAEWPDRARKASVTLSAGADADTRRVMLLVDIKAIFADRNAKWIATSEIIKALVDMNERPWCEWTRAGKPISAQGLRSMLEPFKVFSTQKQEDRDRSRGYAREAFADAWARYLPAVASVHPCTDQQPCGFQPNNDPCTPETGARMQNGPEPSNGAAGARMHGCNHPEDKGYHDLLTEARRRGLVGEQDGDLPAWDDLDGWRAIRRNAKSLEQRQSVATAWAKAAGGWVEANGGTVHLKLPANLRSCLARNELQQLARDAGMLP